MPVIDLLVRNEQLDSITSGIKCTDHWEDFDPKAIETFPKDVESGQLHEADRVLQRIEHDTDQIFYIRFWCEETYKIQIDSCELIEIPDVYAWRAYLMEEEYHPAILRQDGWWFGPDIRPNASSLCFPMASP